MDNPFDEYDRKIKEHKERWCFKHNEPFHRYIDGVWACRECEADAVLDINYPVSTHEADYLNLIGE